MIRLEHIGIAVQDLKKSDALYTKLLGVTPYKHEEVQSENVLTSFFQVGETKIELLQSTMPDGIIANYIKKRGEGIHHIAFEVADIYVEIQRLKDHGFRFVSDRPKQGADNKLVVFLHPKSTQRVLIELTQEIIKQFD